MRKAGRVLGVFFGLEIFVMGIWWRRWLETQSLNAGGYAELVAALGLMIATTFVVRRPFLLRAVLLVSAPPLIYVLAGEGPGKWAGYGYLVTLLAAVLVHRGWRRA